MPVETVVTHQPAMNQPPPPPAKPAAKVEAKPTPAVPPAAEKTPAADPAATEPAQAPSKLARAQEAIAKAEESAKRFRENDQRRVQAERVAQQERQRAAELQQRETARQREEAQRVQREKARQNNEQLSKSPDEWLKAQADKLLSIEDRLQESEARRAALEQHIYNDAKQRRIEAANKAFLESASNSKNYPTLATTNQDVILAAAHQLAMSKGWGDDEILEYLETKLAGQPNKASKKPEKQSAEVHQASAAPKQADTPRAISSSMSKGFTLPENYDRLPEREKRKLLVQKYKADVAAKKEAKDA